MSECKWRKPGEVDCVGYYLSLCNEATSMVGGEVMGVYMSPSGRLVSSKMMPISSFEGVSFYGPIPEEGK